VVVVEVLVSLVKAQMVLLEQVQLAAAVQDQAALMVAVLQAYRLMVAPTEAAALAVIQLLVMGVVAVAVQFVLFGLVILQSPVHFHQPT
jgi:hypothetical protein